MHRSYFRLSEKYINELGKKLKNPEISHQTYLKILNLFLSIRKIPKYPIPSLLVNVEMISNFSKKAELFNKFFCITMCTVIRHKYFDTFPRTDK